MRIVRRAISILEEEGEHGLMAKSRQHQEAHGIGQIEEQLAQQAEAAAELQGTSEADRRVVAASREQDSETEDGFEA